MTTVTIGSSVVNKINIDIFILIIHIMVCVYCTTATSGSVFKECNIAETCFGCFHMEVNCSTILISCPII